MFFSTEQAKIDPFGLFGEEATAWSWIEHAMHRPWFYVTVNHPNDDLGMRSMIMVGNEEVLSSIVEADEQLKQIESVLVVTPDHVNEMGRWAMEKLEWIDRYFSDQGRACSYCVEGGKTYLYGDPCVITSSSVEVKRLDLSTSPT